MKPVCLCLLLALAACGSFGATPTPTFARFTADQVVQQFRTHNLKVDDQPPERCRPMNLSPLPVPQDRRVFLCQFVGVQPYGEVMAFTSPADMDAARDRLNGIAGTTHWVVATHENILLFIAPYRLDPPGAYDRYISALDALR
jgi:hypothetical protein